MRNQRQGTRLRGAFAALLLLALAGCLDDGPGRDDTANNDRNDNETVSGLFQGRLIDGPDVADVTAAIARDGTTIYRLRDNPETGRTIRAFFGQTTGASSPLRFTGDELTDESIMPISFNAELTGETLTAGLDSDGHLRLQRLARSGEEISLTRLAGQYTFLAPGDTIWDATIEADGTVILQPATGACSLQGQVSVPDPTVNIFQLTVPSGPCDAFGEGLTALGSLDRLPPDTGLLRLDGRIGDQPRRLNLFASG